jgi:hypothetical protein
MNAFLNSHQPSYRRENSYVTTPFLALFTLEELLRVMGSYSRLFLRPTELREITKEIAGKNGKRGCCY